MATAPTAAAQQPLPDPALEPLLAKATWYVLDFVDKLSNVVAEEHYIQDSNVMLTTIAIPGLGGRGGPSMSGPRGSAKHRELKADFLIVKSPGDVWQPFRDVFEVDHIPMRDREERLAKLFLGNKTDAEAQGAKAIADESARYNLGAVQRTINNPVFALIFLQPEAPANISSSRWASPIDGWATTSASSSTWRTCGRRSSSACRGRTCRHTADSGLRATPAVS